ncbi:hypothetical protein EKO23_12430 [Nocardioides guangzhouensis]|uniref:Polysaccharide chain length determinant N-terminal domain-containing protein n=1 Tax=Nocardioides guangzhouensis TaxID=2497878 RepID=A0A4Q4ZD57_9ACTN|nr:hypothetical protein [Nocardioides guangzhouensis]RYP85555.1 hypothetical protein EKO23_12430 [Nocardioides guangzhouensis]
MNRGWILEEVPEQQELAGEPAATLVSLHFLRSALMTHWRVWAAFAVAGLALGVLASVLVPVAPKATATLVLTQEQGVDPADGLATDMTLLRTRRLAAAVVDDMDLRISPEALRASVSVLPESGRVIALTVAAPDAEQAVARADAVVEQFFELRNQQMDDHVQAIVGGYQARIDRLRKRVESLTAQYDALGGVGGAGQAEAAEVLTERASLNAEIDRLQSLIEEQELEVSGVRAASHVLDPPALAPMSGMRTVLAGAAGLVGGFCLGAGLVLFWALTSDRLRRREEIAVALGVPVWMSAGPVRGNHLWHLLVHRGGSPDRNRQLLVSALEPDLTRSRNEPVRMALATIGNTSDGVALMSALAQRVRQRGARVFVVDLTEDGNLARQAGPEAQDGGDDGLVVFRPDGIPSLASGPYGHRRDGGPLGEDHPLRARWDDADVVLVLVDVDPAVGVYELSSWVNEVRMVVTAGQCSAERLRTAGELIRAAGLEPEFAVLVADDRRDDSLGRDLRGSST